MPFAAGFFAIFHETPGCVHEGTLLRPSWSVPGALTQSASGKSVIAVMCWRATRSIVATVANSGLTLPCDSLNLGPDSMLR